jgi:hypothetical protein
MAAKRKTAPRTQDIATRDAHSTTDEKGKPRVKILTLAVQERTDKSARELGKNLKLSPEQIAWCAETAKTAHDEVWKADGYMAIRDRLNDASNSVAAVQYKIAMRAEIEAGGKNSTAVQRLAYWDAMIRETEKQEQLHERRIRNEADPKAADAERLEPVEKLLGEYWVDRKSKVRRSFRAGLRPSDFKGSSAFIQASQVKRKKADVDTSQGRKPENVITVDVTDDTQFPAATGAALAPMVTLIKSLGAEHDVQVAAIIMEAYKKLSQYAKLQKSEAGRKATTARDARQTQRAARDEGAVATG